MKTETRLKILVKTFSETISLYMMQILELFEIYLITCVFLLVNIFLRNILYYIFFGGINR